MSIQIFFGAPSCVPATNFEASGDRICAQDIDQMLSSGNFHVLTEMMNFLGVILEEKQVMEKISVALKHGKKIDGHAPDSRGKEMEKYFGAGISTDHECTSLDEPLERIEKFNTKILIR